MDPESVGVNSVVFCSLTAVQIPLIPDAEFVVPAIANFNHNYVI